MPSSLSLGTHVGQVVPLGAGYCRNGVAPGLHQAGFSDAFPNRGLDHEVQRGHDDGEKQDQHDEAGNCLPMHLHLDLSNPRLAHGDSPSVGYVPRLYRAADVCDQEYLAAGGDRGYWVVMASCFALVVACGGVVVSRL